MGVGSFLLLAALGIGVIIFGCVGNDSLLSKSFVYKNGLKKEIKQQKDNYKRSFQLGLALGVMLCILSVAIIPITAFVTNEDEAMMTMSIAIMFAFIAAGVFLFIYVGNVQESYTILLKKGKEKQPTTSSPLIKKQIKENIPVNLVVIYSNNLLRLFFYNILLGDKLDYLDSFRYWF